jgi:hypothetical protein
MSNIVTRGSYSIMGVSRYCADVLLLLAQCFRNLSTFIDIMLLLLDGDLFAFLSTIEPARSTALSNRDFSQGVTRLKIGHLCLDWARWWS